MKAAGAIFSGLAKRGCLALILASSLPAATEQRFSFESTIAPTNLKGDQEEMGSVTRLNLKSAELAAPQRVSFALKMRNFEELKGRIARGEVLTLDEMNERYFPLRETWLKTAHWVRAQGLEVDPEESSHLTVSASGSVAKVQAALQMRFARVRGTDAREYTSAISAPSIPAEFRNDMVGVLDLQPHLVQLPQALNIQQLSDGMIMPQTIAELYRATGLGFDGKGQTIAILGSRRVNPDDLTLFWQTCGLPTTIAQFTEVDVGVLNKQPEPGDSSMAGEETMDIEWASAMAPGAKIVYLSSTAINFVTNWILAEIAAGRPIQQLSSSYGLPESVYLLPEAFRAANDQYYASLAAVGVSVFIPSGNQGSTQKVVGNTIPYAGYDATGVASPQYPASSPYVTAVGGTMVAFTRVNGIVAGLPVQEGAWTLNNVYPPTSPGRNSASGGGESWYFDRPTWQVGLGVPAGTRRLVPDIAAVANSNFRLYVQFQGGHFGAGGTSLSSPIWAGLCALINQARSEAGLPPAGLLGPRLYPLLGTACFNQMTTGSQDGLDGFSTNATNGAYKVGPNYTLITGLGSPNVDYVIAALTTPEPVATPPPNSNPPPSSSPAPTTPTPTKSGGGGVPSPWFLGALGVIFLARAIARRAQGVTRNVIARKSAV